MRSGPGLDATQIELVETLLKADALRFGDFTLKSGRKSAYFVNVGSVATASGLARLAGCYAKILAEEPFGPFGLLYGPAYKGIPLAVATALAYRERTGRDVAWAFDRKEAKDHGEGGVFVGAPLAGARIVIIEDVMTAGTAIRASLKKLASVEGATVVGVLLAVDRQEPGPDDVLATDAITRDFGVPVLAIVKIADLDASRRDPN